MTTRNIQHAEVLASIAHKVAQAHRAEFDTRVIEGLRAERSNPREAMARIRSRAELAGHIDSSWQYTLPEEYQS